MDQHSDIPEIGQPIPDLQHHLSDARHTFYALIARLRRDADKINDQETKMLFEFTAEVLAGLARAFRQFEERQSHPATDEDTGS